jgi:hypothetical protein
MQESGFLGITQAKKSLYAFLGHVRGEKEILPKRFIYMCLCSVILEAIAIFECNREMGGIFCAGDNHVGDVKTDFGFFLAKGCNFLFFSKEGKVYGFEDAGFSSATGTVEKDGSNGWKVELASFVTAKILQEEFHSYIY